MKKSVQEIINNEALSAWEQAKKAWLNKPWDTYGERLRSCTAWVYETNDYYFLESYDTIVAFIDKSTDTCYDVLRYVYGYTSTSAHHISKFEHDYGTGKWGCGRRLTYYPI